MVWLAKVYIINHNVFTLSSARVCQFISHDRYYVQVSYIVLAKIQSIITLIVLCLPTSTIQP